MVVQIIRILDRIAYVIIGLIVLCVIYRTGVGLFADDLHSKFQRISTGDAGQDACLDLLSEVNSGYPDKTSVHKSNLKLCNASAVGCQELRKTVTEEKLSLDGLTCDGK